MIIILAFIRIITTTRHSIALYQSSNFSLPSTKLHHINTTTLLYMMIVLLVKTLCIKTTSITKIIKCHKCVNDVKNNNKNTPYKNKNKNETADW